MIRTWLITGSSRGFGRELAVAALERGNRVVATARRPEQLDDLVRSTATACARSPSTSPTPGPPRRRTAGRRRVRQARRGGEQRRLRQLLPDRGDVGRGLPRTGRSQLLRRRQCHEGRPAGAAAQRSGHILQFSSIGGRVGGSPGLAAYQTAKFAVEGFSEVLNNEVRPLGVKVTSSSPARSAPTGPARPWHRAGGRGLRGDRRRHEPAACGLDRTQPGDPARAARVILDAVDLDEPPLRLLLGSDAVNLAEKSSRAHAAEAARWAEVSRSTDFPPGE